MTTLLEDLRPRPPVDGDEGQQAALPIVPAAGLTEWGRTGAARLVSAAAGVLPVGFIAVAATGVAGLQELAVFVLTPVLLAVVILTGRSRPAWSLLSRALVAGLVATALYDTLRLGLLGLGVLERDPIPHIGEALGLRPAWVFGYLWRYVGDGGGLAVTFVLLGFRGVKAGLLFGLAVCDGLLLTLLLTPYGQDMLFPLTLTTVGMATAGHLIYGGVLGAFAPAPVR